METTSQADPVSAQDRSDSDHAIDELAALSFEVRHPHGQEATILVDQDRCSLGGRADCTIRLSHGEDRVDCLIIRGPSGVVARNWSGLTYLNGHAFRDARLQIGDQLEIAGTTVRLIDRDPVTHARTEVMAPFGDSDQDGGVITESIFRIAAHASNQANEVERNGHSHTNGSPARDARALAIERERRRRLISRLRRQSQLQQSERASWSRARARLERRVAGYSRLAARLQDRIHAELRPRLEELEAKRTRLEQRAGDLEAIQAEFNAAHDEIQRRLQCLADQENAFKAKCQELDARTQTFATVELEITERRNLLDIRAVELTEREDELSEKGGELARQSEHLELERQALADARSLEDQRRELDARAAEISQMAEALHQKQFFLTEAEQALDVERRNLQSREATINGELESLRQECSHAVGELKSSRDELVDVQVQLQHERDNHSEVSTRFALSEQRARDLETALKDAHTELEQLASQVADITEKNIAFHQDERQLRQTIELLENAKSVELEQLQSSQQELAEQLAQWNTERANWERERGALQAEIERFRQMESALAEEQELGQLTQRNHDVELESRRATWESERQRYDQQIAELAAEVQRLRDAEIARIDELAVREEPTTFKQPTTPFEGPPAPFPPTECPTLSAESLKKEIHEHELLQTIGQLEERLQQAERQREEWENEREHLVTAYEQQINEITSLIRDLPGTSPDDDHIPVSLPVSSQPEPCTEDGGVPVPPQLTMAPIAFASEPATQHDVPLAAGEPIQPLAPADEEPSLDITSIFAKYGLTPPDEDDSMAPEADGISAMGDAAPGHPELNEAVDEHGEPREATAAESAAREDSDHRESVESYMTRLLGQLPADWAVENATRADASTKETANSPASLDSTTDVPKQSRDDGPREKPSLPPKRANPLASTDLSAMRELAITSSRLAIQQHDVRRKAIWIGSGLAKILIAVLAGLIVSVWGKSIHPSIAWVGVASAPLALILAYRHFFAPFRRRA